MMTSFEQAASLPQQTLEDIAVLFQKDYTTDALSFIQNHHRIINYWAAGPVNLLPLAYEEEKRRRFSFFDLVWLGLVKELRDFGMSKETIAVLKGELLTPPDHKGLLKQLKTHRKEIEEVLTKNYGIGSGELKSMLEFYLSRQVEIQAVAYSSLALYIIHTLSVHGDVRLLINKEGHHQALHYDGEGTSLQAVSDIYEAAHLSLSLRGVVAFFVALPVVKDTVRQRILSEKEWKLIQLVRSLSPKSIKVHFGEQQQPVMVDITRKKKVSLEARLTEMIVKGGYERIELITQDGKPVYYESTEKIKL